MHASRFLGIMLAAWIVLLPFVAWYEAYLTQGEVLFFLLLDAIESIVFWVGVGIGFFAREKKIQLCTYLVMLSVISVIVIPGASFLEGLYLQMLAAPLFLFINLMEGLILLIGLGVGYLAGHLSSHESPEEL